MYFAIYISNGIGGIEVEYLQYGLRSTVKNVTTQLASQQDLIQHPGRS